MSGTLGLSTPWARDAFAARRAELEALIPDGMTIGVTGHAHAGGRVFRFWVVDEGGDWSNVIERRGVRPVAAEWAIALLVKEATA